MTDRRQRRATILLAVVVAAGCGNPAGRTASTGPALSLPPAATVAPAPTEAGPVVIEDAGVDVALAPGRYTSRVFQPAVELQRPAGWLRRSATRPDGVVIGAATEELTFAIANIDFAQCGDTLVEHPTASEATTLLANAGVLRPKVGRGTVAGHEVALVDLPGDGTPGDDQIDPANGCILTTGAAPYPAESAWTVLTAADAARVVFLEIDGVTLLVIGRSPGKGLDAVIEAVDPLIAGLSFP